MSLERLRIFVCVAKYKNLTQAACELHTSQPSVSRHLKALEREYGVVLYRIVKNGIELTAEGERFLHYTHALIAQFDRFQATFTEPANGRRLTIGGSFGAFGNLLPSTISRFRLVHPEIEIQSGTATSPELEEQLLNSKIDLAVLTRPRYLPALNYEPCGKETVVAIVSKRHPIAKKGTLSIDELGRVPLLIRSRIKGTISKVEARLLEFANQGMAPRIAMCVDSHIALIASVKKGAGVGFIRRECLPYNPTKDNLQILRTPWLKLSYDSYAVYPKPRPTTAAEAFLSLLRKDAKNRRRTDT